MSSVAASKPSRIERILAFILGGLMIASIAAFFAIMIGTWSGMAREQFASGAWPIVTMLPYVGLPAAMLALVALTVIGARRRSAGRDRR